MHKTRAAVLILFLASTLAFGGCLVRQQTGKDGKGPEITMDNSEISASIHAEESELLAGVTAYDKKDGDVTSSLAVEHISNFVEKGRRKISIVAFDSDNHVTHAERELVYNDYTSPVFSLDRPLRFSLNADDLTEGLSAEDCLDGTITDRIRISYEDEISSTPGLYHVTYSVANRAGDVTSLPVTVELYDPAEENGRPQITLSDYLIHLDLQQPFDPQAYLESVSVDQMLYEKREDGALHAASYEERIRERGMDITWYLIGFGRDEELIKRKIAEANMQEYVKILGKKENPYPYIQACDVYIQPSRYEGKCVTVREAQMLGKPVIITNYETAKEQLESGVEGIIVPMQNQECADQIFDLLNNNCLLEQLSFNCQMRKYSNKEEVKKIYRILEKSNCVGKR